MWRSDQLHMNSCRMEVYTTGTTVPVMRSAQSLSGRNKPLRKKGKVILLWQNKSYQEARLTKKLWVVRFHQSGHKDWVKSEAGVKSTQGTQVVKRRVRTWK